jgi:type IV secretion system protein VirD4
MLAVQNIPSDRMIIFTGKDCPPIYAQKLNYFDCSDMAGLYFPNPYHPPMNKVQVKTWYGRAWKEIIEIEPPHKFRDYPQYQGRKFRYVAGYYKPV